MDSGRGSDGGHASGHELENGHLGSGVLASNTVGTELEVRDTALNVLLMGVVKMGVEDLLGVGQRAVVKTLADDAEVLAHLGVVDVVAGFPVGHLDLLGKRGVADSRKGATAKLLELVSKVFCEETSCEKALPACALPNEQTAL